MEEKIKNDLAGIAFTHPFYSGIVDDALGYIKQLEEENKELQKSVDQIYDDYQDIGKMYFNLTEKIENKIEELKISGGSNGRDETENLVRELAIDILQELLEEE